MKSEPGTLNDELRNGRLPACSSSFSVADFIVSLRLSDAEAEVEAAAAEAAEAARCARAAAR
ncbi:MAG: hypothetical protein M3348_18585, partial [Acidobacteriota bacterium]|nr:hypothetical protein [Acidobacteriota bacterium]